MDGAKDDVEEKGGGYLGDDDSLVVVEVIDVVKCRRNCHLLKLMRKLYWCRFKIKFSFRFSLGNI